MASSSEPGTEEKVPDSENAEGAEFMKNLKQLIALALSFILLLGTAPPIHAEESVTDRIRELLGDNKPVSEPEHEAS